MNIDICSTNEWPSNGSLPKNLRFALASIEHPMMRHSFEHAMKHQALQSASGMRAVTSTLVTPSGLLVMGVAGELSDTVTDKSKDEITFHAETGRCDRMQSDGNVDYNKCPGCRHDRHSERAAIYKALRDNVPIVGAEIYLYGQWWVCTPCASAADEAGIKTIYLLPDARALFDRAQPGQAERLAAFQKQWA